MKALLPLLLLLAAPLRASFDGMASSGYQVPWSVQDGGGNTHASSAFRSRSSLGVPASGIPGSQSSASGSFSIYGGYYHRFPTKTVTSTRTRTRTATSTRTRTLTPTPTLTRTATPSPTRSATPTSTSSVSPSATRTRTSTATPTRTPTSTATPFAQLALLKSADKAFVIAGDTITYVLSLTNSGSLAANGVTVWDSLDADTTYQAASGAPVVAGPSMVAWNVGTLGAGASQAFTFSVQYPSGGNPVDNFFSAQGTGLARTDSNTVNVGAGVAPTATNTRTGTATPTSTATPTASPSSSATPSITPTWTPTSTETASPTFTPTATPSSTDTPVDTATRTGTPSSTSTPSPSGTFTRTISPTRSVTASPTFSSTRSSTATPTRSATATSTETVTSTETATLTATLTSTSTVTDTRTATSSPTETASPSSSATPSDTRTATPSASATPTGTPQAASLTLNKQVDKPSALLDEVLVYTIQVYNAGPGVATNVTIVDTLPAYVDFSGPGTLEQDDYGSNDAWRFALSPAIARGPFSIPANVTLTVTLHGHVQNVTYAAGLRSNYAQAYDSVWGPSNQGSASTNVSATQATPTFSRTITLTHTISPTFSVSPTSSRTPSPTATATPTRTGTPSATDTRSATGTRTATSTPSPTATATPTPFAQLAVLKSASVASVTQGDTITYVLQVSNPGAYQALNVTLWDSIDANTGYLAASPAPAVSAGGLVAWNVGTLAAGASASFTFSVSYPSSGPAPVFNQASAASDAVAETLSNSINIGYGAAFTSTFTETPTATRTATPSVTASPSASPSETASESPTPSESATPSATATRTATRTATPQAAPVLSLSITKIFGDEFLGGNDLRYNFAIYSAAGPYATATNVFIDYQTLDSGLLIVPFDYDNTVPLNALLESGDSSPAIFKWHKKGDESAGFESGPYNIPQGVTRNVQLYARVLPIAQGQTCMIEASLRQDGAPMGIVASSSVNILAVAPTATPAANNTATPTPVASQGKILAYPQPAKDNMCFAYHAPAGGKLSLLIYNAAFQIVGRVEDQVSGGSMERSCVDISGMAPGVYFYKAKVGDYSFPMQQFGIAR